MVSRRRGRKDLKMDVLAGESVVKDASEKDPVELEGLFRMERCGT